MKRRCWVCEQRAAGEDSDETNSRRWRLGNDRASGRRVLRPAATAAATPTAHGTCSRAATSCFHASTAGCFSGDALQDGTALGAWSPQSLGTLGFRTLSAKQSWFRPRPRLIALIIAIADKVRQPQLLWLHRRDVGDGEHVRIRGGGPGRISISSTPTSMPPIPFDQVEPTAVS
jgi:hypothetical protein